MRTLPKDHHPGDYEKDRSDGSPAWTILETIFRPSVGRHTVPQLTNALMVLSVVLFVSGVLIRLPEQVGLYVNLVLIGYMVVLLGLWLRLAWSLLWKFLNPSRN